MNSTPEFDEATGTYKQESDQLLEAIEQEEATVSVITGNPNLTTAALSDGNRTTISDEGLRLKIGQGTGPLSAGLVSRIELTGFDRRSLVPNGILSDGCIDIYAKAGMIENYLPTQIREVHNASLGKAYRGLSAGLTSYGYDVRLSDKFEMMIAYPGEVVDPKRPNPKLFAPLALRTDGETGEVYVELPPHSYLLGHTPEYFRMPRDVVAQCIGKSTYARHGILVNVTPIEPGFEGQVVIEIFNCSPSPVRIYAYEGVAQFMFFKGPPCEVSYADRAGKYQGQTGIRHGEVG